MELGKSEQDAWVNYGIWFREVQMVIWTIRVRGTLSFPPLKNNI